MKNTTIIGALGALGLALVAYLTWNQGASSTASLPAADSEGSAPNGAGAIFASANGALQENKGLAGTWAFSEGGGMMTCGDIQKELPLKDSQFTVSPQGGGKFSFSDPTCDYEMQKDGTAIKAASISCDSKQQVGQTLRIEEHRIQLVNDTTAQVKMSATFSLKIPSEQAPRACTVTAQGVASRAGT